MIPGSLHMPMQGVSGASPVSTSLRSYSNTSGMGAVGVEASFYPDEGFALTSIGYAHTVTRIDFYIAKNRSDATGDLVADIYQPLTSAGSSRYYPSGTRYVHSPIGTSSIVSIASLPLSNPAWITFNFTPGIAVANQIYGIGLRGANFGASSQVSAKTNTPYGASYNTYYYDTNGYWQIRLDAETALLFDLWGYRT